MQYVGEHTFIGQLGNSFLILAFCAIVLATVAYFFAAQRDHLEKKNWIKIARWGFTIHSISVFAVAGILLFMLYNRFYEYGYVAKNASSDMPLRYILSSFWGAQEGSFLLWIFWHVVIGNVLFRTARDWEAPTMAIFSGVQALLVSMLLGIYIFDFRFGSNPFVLSRELMLDARMLWNYLPDYLSFDPSFQDGSGLNPLLRNYWMTIHPPTLFLGFAATLVPFCFAIAALWKKRYMEWIKPALAWTYFGVFILGAGILMGGIWAYESLSFGGFWAWDPVENASFVPWLTLVGGAHVMMVNQKKNNSLFTAFLLILLSFILVMYSTFLTRTGVLGDSSVHSFTGEGMLGILLVYLLLCVYLTVVMLLIDKKLKLYFTAFTAVLAIFELASGNTAVTTIAASAGIFIFLFIAHKNYFPKDASSASGERREEELWSREFWMFIGGLVLLLSAIQIIAPTSIPVYNLIFGTEHSPYVSEERNAFYNSWQEPFAFVVCLLVAIGQLLKYTPAGVDKMDKEQLKAYRKKTFVEFGKKTLLSLSVALVLTVLISIGVGFESHEVKHIMFLFAALFAVFANLDYFIRFVKGKLNYAGASIAHIGFAILMIGTLISQSKKLVISENVTAGHNLQYYNKKFDNNTDIQLFMGDMKEMGPYFVNFKGVELDKTSNYNYFQIEYFEKVPRKYKAGDTVRVDMALVVAKKNHTAAAKFDDKQSKNWEIVPPPYGNEFFKYKKWNGFAPGKKIDEISPFLQLTKSSRPSPEPGTKHFLTHDIFTHLVYADPVTMNGKKEGDYHSALKPMKNHRDKPFFADRYNMFVRDIQPVQNNADYNLKDTDTAAIVHMEFYELTDTMLSVGYKAEQLFVKKFGKYRIRGELELPDLKLKLVDANFTTVQKPVVEITEEADWMKPFGIDTLKPEHLGVDSSVIALINADTSLEKGLNVDRMWTANHPPAKVIDELPISDNLEDVEMTFIFAPREFILLRAMQFPYINVLWIGCVLMTLGTLMAVIYRIRNNRRSRKKTAA